MATGGNLAERTDETEVLSRDRLPADPLYGVHSAKPWVSGRCVFGTLYSILRYSPTISE